MSILFRLSVKIVKGISDPVHLSGYRGTIRSMKNFDYPKYVSAFYLQHDRITIKCLQKKYKQRGYSKKNGFGLEIQKEVRQVSVLHQNWGSS